MSQYIPKLNNDIEKKNKLISISDNSNKISKLNSYKKRNFSLFNVSPKETKKNSNKINYTKTDTDFSSNNINSRLKSGKLNLNTEQNFKKLNEIQLNSPNLKILQNNNIKKTENNINKHRIFSANILKNKKRISFFNYENINKHGAQIYMNGFNDKIINDIKNKRILTSIGFKRQLEIDTEKVLKNKNKRQYTSYKNTNPNSIKNLDLNFHNTNYKYGFVSTEKNQNLLQKEMYYDIIMKNKILKNKNVQTSLTNKSGKENYFRTIINNITRKVQFLNSKNNILSNENTMNLLNKEEYFLYKKLKDFFKDNCSIKKFSKSIFDSKNGNKYLLPLFNEINFAYKNIEEKNKNEISKIDDEFNLDKDKIYNKNEFNQKNSIEFFLNKKLKRQKKNNYINNIFFSSNNESNKNYNQNSKINKSSDENDSENDFENLREIDNNINNNKNKNNKIVVLHNKKKDDLIEKNKYQEYKMYIIQQNENIINNYHQKIDYSQNAFSPKKQIYVYKSNKNITPIKANNKYQKKETKNLQKEKRIRIHNSNSNSSNNKNNNKASNKNNNLNNKIRPSNSEKKEFSQNKEIKLIKRNVKKEIANKFNILKNNLLINIKVKENTNNQKLTRNHSKINKSDKTDKTGKIESSSHREESKKETIRRVARLSTKNYYENMSSKSIKTANNEDIKNLLFKGDNFYSEYAKKFMHNRNLNLNSPSRNNIGLPSNENTSNSKDRNSNRKNNKEKTLKKQISKTFEQNINNDENNLNHHLNIATISNNLILKASIEKEENILIEKLEKKKSNTLKLLYTYLKAHLKDLLEKDKIKQLLKNPEFKQNFDIFKNQMNKLNELKKDSNSNKRKSKILSDEDIIDILYEEVNKKQQKKLDKNMPKSSYIPLLHLKKRLSQRQRTNLKIEVKEEEEEKEKKKNDSQINLILQKENEKLELIATEISLSNELKHHIRETFNNEFKARLQMILDKIESYQNLDTIDYIDTFKNNYELLKEEMNQVLKDKEREERINSFMNHLDSDRNIFETKWNFCNNKINIIDNKLQTSFGINSKINYI